MMNECRRLSAVHPDAPYPERWIGTRPMTCKEHFFRKMEKDRLIFEENMKKVEKTKKTLNKKIKKSIKSKTDILTEELEKTMNELRISMKSEDNYCDHPSIYLPEFGREFTNESCPYMKKEAK